MEQSNCQNLVDPKGKNRLRDIKECSRTAKYYVLDKRTGNPIERLCSQHKQLIAERGNFGPDVEIIEIEKFCGFCRGICKGEHYISPATEGY